MHKNDLKRRRVGRFVGLVLLFGGVCLGMLSGICQAASFRSFLWYDASRNRSVPVKIFYPAETGKKFPVIVFSHGLGGSIECCSYLANAWVSKGFVAVFLQHPGSDENIWKGKIRILSEFKEAYQRNWTGRTRAEDIRFVLDRLEQLGTENPSFAEKIDYDRIGVGGYDLGCLASLLVAGQVPSDGGQSLRDSRIKAVLAMSPPIRYIGKSFQEVYEPITVPMFVITGTEDDSIVGPTKASQRRIPFDYASKNSRYLVIFQGADHRIYGGRIFSLSAGNDQLFQSAIVRASSCFWQAVLQEDQKAQTRLNGYGSNSLNSLLGGIAKVERRFVDTENSSSIEKPIKEMKTAEPTGKTGNQVDSEAPSEEPTESTGNFPVSQFYRRVIQNQSGK